MRFIASPICRKISFNDVQVVLIFPASSIEQARREGLPIVVKISLKDALVGNPHTDTCCHSIGSQARASSSAADTLSKSTDALTQAGTGISAMLAAVSGTNGSNSNEASSNATVAALEGSKTSAQVVVFQPTKWSGAGPHSLEIPFLARRDRARPAPKAVMDSKSSLCVDGAVSIASDENLRIGTLIVRLSQSPSLTPCHLRLIADADASRRCRCRFLFGNPGASLVE